MAKEQTAEIMVVFNGKDFPLSFKDLGLPTEPHMTSDADLLAACENALDQKAGSFRSLEIKRPATGRILISGAATLG